MHDGEGAVATAAMHADPPARANHVATTPSSSCMVRERRNLLRPWRCTGGRNKCDPPASIFGRNKCVPPVAEVVSSSYLDGKANHEMTQ